MPGTTIEMFEKVAESVADWGADVIEDALNNLTKDGKPFGMESKTMDEKLQVYLPMRFDVKAFEDYIETIAQGLVQEAETASMPMQYVLATHPYDIAVNKATHFSYEMELYIDELNAKSGAGGSTPGPTDAATSSPTDTGTADETGATSSSSVSSY